MKNLLIGVIILVLAFVIFVATGQCFESTTMAVVDGRMTTSSSYYAFGGGGENQPFFENQFQSRYSVAGGLQFGQQTALSGGIIVQEQVDLFHGRATGLTKTGVGSLLTYDDGAGGTSGRLDQKAIGFGFDMVQNGTFAAGFTSVDDRGFMGISESTGFGTYRAGARSQITTGGMSDPTIVERTDFHWTFGPGQYQVQVEIVFPNPK